MMTAAIRSSWLLHQFPFGCNVNIPTHNYCVPTQGDWPVMMTTVVRSSRPIHQFPLAATSTYPLKRALCGVQWDINAFSFTTHKMCWGVLGGVFFYSFIAKKITKIKIFVEIVKLCFAISKCWNVVYRKTSQHVCQIWMYSLLPAFNICCAVTVYIEKQIFAVFKITEPFKIQRSRNSSTSNAYAWTAVAFFIPFFCLHQKYVMQSQTCT